MHNLATATPVQIDTELSGLYQAEFGLEAKLAGALLAIRRGLGQKATTTGRGISRREEWPTTAEQAVAAMRDKGETLIGMMRPASALVEKYDAAAAELTANREAQAVLDGEHDRRGGWTRFYYVSGGHVHRIRNCSTLHNGRERTRLEWLVEWSGRDQAEAIAELARQAHTLCSQPCCFPGAPVVVVPRVRLTAEEKAARKAELERKARIEEPKLIAAPDGEPLRVDSDLIRTVRTAEIKLVDALWWAAFGRYTGEANEPYALDHERQARQLAEALAHKRGTTVADELTAAAVKATKKIKKDLGAEAAEQAAGDHVRLVRAAETDAETETGTETAAPAGDPLGSPAGAGETARAAAEQLPTVGQWPATETAGQRETETETAAETETETAPLTGLALVRLAAGSSAREAVAVIQRSLVAVGQITRDLDDRQLAELGRRLGTARPLRVAEQLHPFLAARLAAADDGTATRKCCTLDAGDADCASVHPGFTTPTAAFAAIAAEIEAEAADPAGYLAAQLGALDAAAAGEAYCRFCRCTENRACPGGCAWASDTAIRAAGLEPMEGDVCTACLPGGDEAQLAAYAAADARRDDADLDDAAAGDGQVAEVLAIAAAAPSVTVTDPAGLLELVKQYGAEWHRFLALGPDTARIDDADRAEAAAAGTLSRIAEALGLGGTAAASVPGPRVAGD